MEKRYKCHRRILSSHKEKCKNDVIRGIDVTGNRHIKKKESDTEYSMLSLMLIKFQIICSDILCAF